MRQRVLFERAETVPLATLEALLKARMGWVDSAISPFAIAAREQQPDHTRVVQFRPAQASPVGRQVSVPDKKGLLAG